MAAPREPYDVIKEHTPEYHRALIALFFIGLSTFALLYAIQPVMRPVGLSFGRNAAQASLLMSVTTAALAIAVLPVGKLVKRVGARPIIIGGLGIAVLAGVGVVLVDNWWWILAMRALQGFALSGPPAATLAWVAHSVEPAAVTKTSGLYIAGTTIGGMGGRLLSGFAAQIADSWHAGILAVGLFSVVLGGLAHLLLPVVIKPSLDYKAAKRNDTPHRQHQRWRSYTVAFLGMGMFVGVFNVLGYRIALPPWSLGTGVGSMFFLSYLAGTFSSARTGSYHRRFEPKLTFFLGLILMAGGVMITLPENVITLWIGLIFFCAGFFILHAEAASRASILHPDKGTGSGRYLLYYYLGSSVGGIAMGFAWDLGAWLGVVIACGFCFAILAVVISGADGRRFHAPPSSAI